MIESGMVKCKSKEIEEDLGRMCGEVHGNGWSGISNIEGHYRRTSLA